MYRPPTMGDPGGNGNNANGNGGGGNNINNNNLYWSAANYRQPQCSSSTNSAENNLREIRDSLVPYRSAAGAGAYSSKSMASTQAISSSTGGTFIETSSLNASSSFWTAGQPLTLPPPPNGFSLTSGGNFDSSYGSGGFIKSMTEAANQSTKFRPTGVHHKEALIQIKQSLQPYSTTTGAYSPDGGGGAGNMDTLSSESSSGTTGSAETAGQNGPPLHESILLDQLVQMGFERESAWYALKLTQFRSLNLAVDVLLKLNMSHVFRDQDTRSTVSRKPSFDNGENGVGRSESPMPRIPTPQGRQQYQTGAAMSSAAGRPTLSAVSTSGAVYSIPVANQRTPSPMSKSTGTAAAMSNYVTVVPPPHFGPTTTQTPTSSTTNPASTYVNGGDASGYFAAGGPKRSHITVNLQSPPRNSSRGNGASMADPLFVRERSTPIILQADKRQVEKPVAQTAVSPTIIAVNNNHNLMGQHQQQQQQQPQAKFISGDGRQQQPTKVLSAHFDPQNLQTVRINVQPASDPNGGGHYVMKYQLEANTTSGHMVSIQGRGECPTASTSTSGVSTMDGDMYADSYVRQNPPMRSTPLSSTMKLSSQRILLSSPLDSGLGLSNEGLSNQEKAMKSMPPLDYSLAMAHLQKQQQQQQQQQHLQNYHHHIVVGGGSGLSENNNVDDSAEQQQQQQAFAQRLKLANSSQATAAYGHHPMTTGIPIQKRESTETANNNKAGERSSNEQPFSSSMMSFIPLPARMAISRTIDCFPTLKEESISLQAPFSSRTDRASPTSSVSTEESENSGCGATTTTSTTTNPVINNEPLIRCESPLPDSVLQRYHHCDEDDGQQASTNNSGNGGIGGGGVGGGNSGSSVRACTPQAFKFFMEQHVENVIKQHHERQTRRMQLEKEMVKAELSSQVQCQMRKLLNNKESNYLRMRRQKMNASMFEKMKAIGVGAFGEVALVRKKDTDTLFAMKTLRKSDVIQKNQAAHVKAERDILSEADNEWVVKLFYSFQDKEHLFFIMEYIPGGDMMALLIKKGIFEEDLARFYVAELFCAIQSVHKLGFIHRDIKPDNILIDRNGHIKLTDFGLCTGLRWTHDWKYYAETPKIPGHTYQDSFDLLQLRDPDSEHKVLAYRNQKPRQKSHSLVGTPNYIAPEVLTRSGHTQLCDWWSVGVILYEMVIGHPPFLANTPEETQIKVVNWRKTLRIPPEANLSPVTTDLILRLCCGVEDRLGRERYATDIMDHPFFEQIHWPTLRSAPAPYRPEILGPMDTSNFDPVEPRLDFGPPGAFGTEKMSKHDHAFYEFTFRRFFDSDGHGCPTLKSKPIYQHPKLATVVERSSQSNNAASIVGGDDHDEKRAATISNAGAYNRSPVYLNERAINILRISTDDRQQRAAKSYVSFDDPDDDEEAVAVFSGPGRPRTSDSFSCDDPSQAHASDFDDETSDSAVYV